MTHAFSYHAEPHPHLVVAEIVPPAEYAALRFPDHLVAAGEAWGITAGDADYEEVLADPAWRRLHDELRGERLVRLVLAAFGDDMRRASCLVDQDASRLIDYTESRSDKEQADLPGDVDPNELYTRMDFQSKGLGAYRDFVHLDWGRRIVGGILFFSDAAEEGLEGGELALYRDRDFRDDRWCHDPELTASFAPRHNTGVIFLNSNAGFHGPLPIRRLAGRRRWLYFTISSRVDVWPARRRAAS